MMRKLTNDEFLIKLKQINSNTIPLEKYVNARRKIKFKCLNCGNVWVTLPCAKNKK